MICVPAKRLKYPRDSPRKHTLSTSRFLPNRVKMVKKTYQEVVRGLRSAGDPTMYISEVLTEIRQEIRGTDRHDKVVSLLKLLYLNLIGYTFEWAVCVFYFLPHV